MSLSKNIKSKEANILSEEDTKNLIHLYDGEIKYVDECIGCFLDNLKNLDIYDNSIILLFSDHGEMLGEHGLYSHEPYHLYKPQLHVPLIISDPTQKHRNINHPVTLMDVTPTVFNFLGNYNSFFSDNDLIMKKREYIISEGFKPQDVITNSEFNVSKVNFSCRWDKWELIFNSLNNSLELYNIEKDSKEENNLIEQKKDIMIKLMAVIENHKKRISKTQDIKTEINKAIRGIKI
jgi:arylsulfatase A-like enzyme